jgi:hypothetical protein
MSTLQRFLEFVLRTSWNIREVENFGSPATPTPSIVGSTGLCKIGLEGGNTVAFGSGGKIAGTVTWVTAATGTPIP